MLFLSNKKKVRMFLLFLLNGWYVIRKGKKKKKKWQPNLKARCHILLAFSPNGPRVGAQIKTEML